MWRYGHERLPSEEPYSQPTTTETRELLEIHPYMQLSSMPLSLVRCFAIPIKENAVKPSFRIHTRWDADGYSGTGEVGGGEKAGRGRKISATKRYVRRQDVFYVWSRRLDEGMQVGCVWWQAWAVCICIYICINYLILGMKICTLVQQEVTYLGLTITCCVVKGRRLIQLNLQRQGHTEIG